MTLESFRQKVKGGITGQDSPTCFPAAVDAISNRHSLSGETYDHYAAEYFEQQVHGESTRRTRTEIRRMLEEAGGSSEKGISEKRVRTPEQLEQELTKAQQGGRRVIALTDDNHVVGLRPVRDGWRMVGTHTPVESDKPLRPKELFPHLHQPARWKGKAQPNLISLNAEPKK